MSNDSKNKDEITNDYNTLLEKYNRLEHEFKKSNSDLKERVKELNCLYAISELTRQNILSIHNLLHSIVELIPDAMQYPELTVARVKCDNISYTTKGFRETLWSLSSNILNLDDVCGSVDVFYVEECPEMDIGPFLFFEERLIKSIAERISRIVERHNFFMQMVELENFNARIIANLQEGIFVCDRNLQYMVWNKQMEEISGLPASEVIGRRAEDVFPHVLLSKAIDYMHTALHGKVVSSGDAFYDIPHSGKKGWYMGLYSPHISAGGEIIGVIGTIREISKYKEAEENLRDSRENLRRFASHLQTIREEERTMIAREIHDELGQSLTAMKINLSMLHNQIKSDSEDNIENEIFEMQKLLDNTIKRMRKLMTELRPEVLDKLGLIEAIEHHLNEFCRQIGLKFALIKNVATIELQDSVALAVFRIFQESLTNVARHSKAGKVEITIDKSDTSILMTIEDNGIGIESSMLHCETSFGLIGMKERAAICGGELEISSKQGKGTTVKVIIPLENKQIRKRND